MSTFRNVNAGAPQGSVLGTYVFNIAIDDLEDKYLDNELDMEFELNDSDREFLKTDLPEQLTNPLWSGELQYPDWMYLL